MLVPLDLTHVVYDDSHALGIVFALLTYTPFVIGIALFTLFLFTRDLECINQLCACVGSTAVNTVLKQLLRQPRPINSVKQGFGMPSDHSQFMAACLIYVTLWLTVSGRVSFTVTTAQTSASSAATAAASRSGKVQKAIIIALLLLNMCAVMYSRVFLGVHSVQQVLVGCCCGVVYGCCWYLLSSRCLWPFVFPLIESSAIGRALYIHDNGCIQYPLHTMYQVQQQIRVNAAAAATAATTADAIADASSSKKVS